MVINKGGFMPNVKESKPTLLKMLKNADWNLDRSETPYNLALGKQLVKNVIVSVEAGEKEILDLFDVNDLRNK